MGLFLLFLFLFQGGVPVLRAGDKCMPRGCPGPYKDLLVRFPFRLKGFQPERCGYPLPGFTLSCSQFGVLLLDPRFSNNPIYVDRINYDIQQLELYPGNIYRNCYLGQNLNLSGSPFYVPGQSFFSCPSLITPANNYYPICVPSFPNPGDKVYAFQNSNPIDMRLLSCTKLDTNASSFLSDSTVIQYGLYLGWDKPNCSDCESNGSYCKLKNNNGSSKGHETECTDTLLHLDPNGPNPLSSISRQPESKKTALVKGVISSGLCLCLATIIAICFLYRSNRIKKLDQIKIERFLEDYKALKPTRYTYAEIKKITDKFKYELGQGGYGTVYKGKLSNEVHIAAKILINHFEGNGDDFINEVGTIGKIHHVNVVRLVGYCADGYKRALVYEYLPNDTLQNVISSNHKKNSLGWPKLHDIALGIAKGIEYLHQGCDQQILHFDIKPHNILLDQNFIPKVSDFGLAKLCSKEQSAVSMTVARGTVGYIAPEVFSRNFGNVSHKSDVYSFGMLLLEMVGGRNKPKVVGGNTNDDEVYFPEWIYNSLNPEVENNFEIEEDGDAKIVKKLKVVGLWCIQWYPGDRPAMKAVVQMLERDGEALDMPPNPFAATNGMTSRGSMAGRNFSSILEVITESE
ncbi:hypothetical protein U1Q18_001830 [Sarracenia purpurea var. burkii]